MKKSMILAAATIVSTLSGCAVTADQLQAMDPSSDFITANCEAYYQEGTFPNKVHSVAVDMIKVNPHGKLYYHVNRAKTKTVKFSGDQFQRSTVFTGIWCKDTSVIDTALEASKAKGRVIATNKIDDLQEVL